MQDVFEIIGLIKCFRKMSVCFLVGLSIVMFTACGGGNGNSQTWIKASVATG